MLMQGVAKSNLSLAGQPEACHCGQSPNAMRKEGENITNLSSKSKSKASHRIGNNRKKSMSERAKPSTFETPGTKA
jgi:hypothetical protein